MVRKGKIPTEQPEEPPPTRGPEPSRAQAERGARSEISPRADFSSALLNEVQVGNGTGRWSSDSELAPGKSSREVPDPLGKNSYARCEEDVLITPKAKPETSYLVLRVWLW